jgi:hypothetical protein
MKATVACLLLVLSHRFPLSTVNVVLLNYRWFEKRERKTPMEADAKDMRGYISGLSLS